jgi:rRNA processing protein Gar1
MYAEVYVSCSHPVISQDIVLKMESHLMSSALFTMVLLLLWDFTNPSKHKDTNDIWNNLVIDDNHPIVNMGENSHTAGSMDDVLGEVNEDYVSVKTTISDDFDNWNDQEMASSPTADNQVFIKANEKRGRRHRELKYIKSVPQDLKAQLKALSRGSSRDFQGSPKDMVSIYNALANELEAKEQLMSRLDALELEMTKIQDVTRYNSVNVTSAQGTGCNCSDSIKREELESVKVHLRRMYLMLNAQEERHRDMLDLVKAYR